jgi:hypothetical protein
MTRYWFAAAFSFTLSQASVAQQICAAQSYVGDSIPDSLNIATSLSDGDKAFSLRAKSAFSEGYGRNLLCFQYQIVNAGTEAIPLVFWNLLDDYTAKDLNGQGSRFRNRVRPTLYEGPIKAQTKIKGFRAAETLAQAWQTVEDAGKAKESNAVKDPVYAFAKASTLDPAVAGAVKSGFLPDDDVAVVDFKASQGRVGAVSDAIGSDDGLVVTSSEIVFKEKTLLSTYLKIKMAPDSQVRIFSPFFSALLREPAEASQFLVGISRYAKEPTPLVAASVNADEMFSTVG